MSRHYFSFLGYCAFALGIFSCQTYPEIQPVKPLSSYTGLSGNCDLSLAVSQAQLQYPAAAASMGQEGWVMIRFDIVAGMVSSIEVVDASPKGVFNSSARHYISSLQFPVQINQTDCIKAIDYRLRSD